jgi:hypothetical protein
MDSLLESALKEDRLIPVDEPAADSIELGSSSVSVWLLIENFNPWIWRIKPCGLYSSFYDIPE